MYEQLKKNRKTPKLGEIKFPTTDISSPNSTFYGGEFYQGTSLGTSVALLNYLHESHLKYNLKGFYFFII